MAEIISNKTKPKAREALLEMAKEWDKQGKIQHATQGYEAVIEAEKESAEANQARDALLEIAERFKQKGKKHAAFHLYHKLAEGRAGSHNRI